MTLVDTSVWIDYFNGKDTAQTRWLYANAGSEPLLIGDIILGELLQGFQDQVAFDTTRQYLARFGQVSLIDPQLAVECARNYRRLRREGITIRKTIDCIIATYCIEVGCCLLHCDRDFDPFEAHLGLCVIHPERQSNL